jgi:hexosaminidase
LDRLGVRYRIPEVEGLEENGATLESHVQLTLHPPLAGATIRYTLDGTPPDEKSPRYEHPLDVALDAEGTPVAARLILADGRKGPVSQATFRRTTLHPATRIDSGKLKPGLARAYYEHELQNTRGLAQLQPVRRDVAAQIGIPDYARPEAFALTFDGYLGVPSDGLYDFRLESDDGAALRIDGEIVVDRDGPQSLAESSGQVGLAAGLHAISLKYFQDSGGKGLNLRVRQGAAPLQPIAAMVLMHLAEAGEK